MSAPDSGPLAQVTAADVLRWGRAQPADASVGECCDTAACLIARYAKCVRGASIEVCPDPAMADAYYIHGRNVYALPNDLNVLAIDFDDLRFVAHGYRTSMHPADLDRLEATS